MSSQPSMQAISGDKEDDIEKGIGEDDSSANQKNKITWRHAYVPTGPREVIIIGSYGALKNWLQQKLVVHKVL